MKKLTFLFAFLVTFFVTTEAQHVSSDKLMKTVSVVRSAQNELDTRVDSLTEVVAENQWKIDSLLALVPVIKNPVKSQEDANTLFAILSGLLNFLIVGVFMRIKAFKAFIEKYLSKGVFTIIVGALFVIIISVTTKDLTVMKVAGYLIGVLGTHFSIFTITKQKTPEPA